nr:MAG TPA: hypothetical protein [Caudoviricetes sp.]
MGLLFLDFRTIALLCPIGEMSFIINGLHYIIAVYILFRRRSI